MVFNDVYVTVAANPFHRELFHNSHSDITDSATVFFTDLLSFSDFFVLVFITVAFYFDVCQTELAAVSF